MNIAQVIHGLETAQQAAATEAMERPGGRTEFDYGKAVGFYAGLAHAKTLIDGMYAEEQDRLNRT